MPEHNWSLLCTRPIVDQKTNQLTLIDTIEDASLDRDPELLATLEREGKVVIAFPAKVVTLWSRSDLGVAETFFFRTLLRLPNGEEVPAREAGKRVDLTSFQRMRLFTDIQGIRFIGPGLYRFIIQWRPEDSGEWGTVGTIPMAISYHEPQPGNSRSAPAQSAKRPMERKQRRQQKSKAAVRSRRP